MTLLNSVLLSWSLRFFKKKKTPKSKPKPQKTLRSRHHYLVHNCLMYITANGKIIL